MDNFTVCAGLSYSSRKRETTLESTKKGWVQREGDRETPCSRKNHEASSPQGHELIYEDLRRGAKRGA